MQVHCPNCSTAYDIPPLVRPRRLRCARCETEWREMPPETDGPAASPLAAPSGASPEKDATIPPDHAELAAGKAVQAEEGAPPVLAVAPSLADALQIEPTGDSTRRGRGLWLVLWLISLAIVTGCAIASWHWRGTIERMWPESFWLFRLFPGGIVS